MAAALVYKHWNQVVSFVRKLSGLLAGAGRGMWDWITGGLKLAGNAALDAFQKMLNTVIHGLNDALNAVDVAAGTWVNFPKVPDIHIPRLARGGTVTGGPMLAMIGDNPSGREAVVPLDSAGVGLAVVKLAPEDRALLRQVAEAVAKPGTLRLETRGSEVLARIVRRGEASLGGIG